MRQQRVLVGDVSVGMKADRRDVVGSFASFFIQRLNIFQLMLEFQVAGFDLVRRQGVEHKRVIRIGRVSERNCLLLSCCCHYAIAACSIRL